MRQHIYRPVVGFDNHDLLLDDMLLFGDNSSDLEVNADDMLLRRIYIGVCLLNGYDQYTIREDIADLLIQDFTLNLFSPEKIDEISKYCRANLMVKDSVKLYAFWGYRSIEKYISRRTSNITFNTGALVDLVIDNDSYFELYYNNDTGESLFVSTKPTSYTYGHCMAGTVDIRRKLEGLWNIKYMDVHDVITNEESVEIR